jgi:hypothetical protein
MDGLERGGAGVHSRQRVGDEAEHGVAQLRMRRWSGTEYGGSLARARARAERGGGYAAARWRSYDVVTQLRRSTTARTRARARARYVADSQCLAFACCNHQEFYPARLLCTTQVQQCNKRRRLGSWEFPGLVSFPIQSRMPLLAEPTYPHGASMSTSTYPGEDVDVEGIDTDTVIARDASAADYLMFHRPSFNLSLRPGLADCNPRCSHRPVCFWLNSPKLPSTARL